MDDKERTRRRNLRMMKKQAERSDNERARDARRKLEGPNQAPRQRSRSTSGRDEDARAFEPIRKKRNQSHAGSRAETSDPKHREGRVLEVHRDRFLLRVDEEEIHGLPRPPADSEPPVIGDRVLVRLLGDGFGRITSVLPRATEVVRTDPAHPDQRLALAANVDIGVIVSAWDAPPFRPGLVERVVLSLRDGNVTPHLCINKCDRLDENARQEVEQVANGYAEQGIATHRVSAIGGDGIAALKEALRGKVVVFIGHSGVGKSSLTNALIPAAARETGAVRTGDLKGRHTTTASAWIEGDDGMVVIDTPGIRAFGIDPVAPHDLNALFPEIAEQAKQCRFRDCAHTTEPGCGVTAALTQGTLDPTRLARWRALRAISTGS